LFGALPLSLVVPLSLSQVTPKGTPSSSASAPILIYLTPIRILLRWRFFAAQPFPGPFRRGHVFPPYYKPMLAWQSSSAQDGPGTGRVWRKRAFLNLDTDLPIAHAPPYFLPGVSLPASLKSDIHAQAGVSLFSPRPFPQQLFVPLARSSSLDRVLGKGVPFLYKLSFFSVRSPRTLRSKPHN